MSHFHHLMSFSTIYCEYIVIIGSGAQKSVHLASQMFWNWDCNCLPVAVQAHRDVHVCASRSDRVRDLLSARAQISTHFLAPQNNYSTVMAARC